MNMGDDFFWDPSMEDKAKLGRKAHSMVNKKVLRVAIENQKSDKNWLSSFYIKIITDDEVPFRKQIELLKEQSDNLKRNFLSADLKSLNTAHNFPIFLLTVAEYYMSLIFFPDDDIKQKFADLKFSLAYQKWMIPIENVVSEIDKIGEDQRFWILKDVCFNLIYGHLQDKVIHEVFKWGSLQGSKGKKSDLEKGLKLFFRRESEGNGKLKLLQNRDDAFLTEALLNFDRTMNYETGAKSVLLNKVKGRTEKNFLKEILLANIPYAQISDAQYCTVVFPLFRLICKDKLLLSEDQFKAKITAFNAAQPSDSEEGTPYDGIYSNYQYTALKKLIFKNY
jgi:hypothetical protein